MTKMDCTSNENFPFSANKPEPIQFMGSSYCLTKNTSFKPEWY